MIIQLDWFGCNRRSKWEGQIHQTLEQAAMLKNISRAQVRVSETPEQTPRYSLTMLLSIPGPDVQMSSSGHTFDEAMLKLQAMLRKTLLLRSRTYRKVDAAPLGVKASHRG
jgi:hypothetical protein